MPRYRQEPPPAGADTAVPTRSIASRSRAALWLVPAGITETGWVFGVKTAAGPLAWGATALGVAASLWLALRATRELPVTTVYVLFVALGTIGAFLLDTLFFETTVSTGQLVWLAVLIVALVGLKKSTPT